MIVTLGAEGLAGYDAEGPFRAPAVGVATVSTHGCGR
ncbi:MAG: carbohydrate kinase, partial [Rhodobacteraceae bacterium]|nr:carbohydrate kinase [Paracoccaceae bacterium]